MRFPVGYEHLRIQVVPQQLERAWHLVIELDGLDIVRQEPAALVERPMVVGTEAQKVAHLVRALVAKSLNVRCLRYRTTRR